MRYAAFRNTSSLLLVVASSFALSACSRHAGGDESTAVKAEVTLTHVVRADISQTLTLTGNAVALPNQDVRVSSLVAGPVADVKVAEGDRVHAGELLARIDNRTYGDQLSQAEASEQQAKATLENARLALARNEDLFRRGIAARKDVEDSQTQQHVAAAAERQAQAALEIARLQVARTQILSPLTGLVVKRFVSVGEQVDGTAAQPVVEVAALGQLEFLANATAAYLSKMHSGEAVPVTTEALPGKVFHGHIVAISPAVDPSTGVGGVRVRVPNSGGLLRLGLFLSAQIPIEKHLHALCLPPDSIYRNDASEPRVFVVNDGTATAAPVTLGIQTKDLVEVLSGVKEGDTVILTGGYGLPDTAKVTLAPASAGPPPSSSAPAPESAK